MANTTNRAYPKPVASHLVSADLPLIQQALDMIDVDVAAALLAMTIMSFVRQSSGLRYSFVA